MKGLVDMLKNEVRDKEHVESALEDMGGELECVQAALTAALEQYVLQFHANAVREAERQRGRTGERDQEMNELKVEQQKLNRRDLMFLCEQIDGLRHWLQDFVLASEEETETLLKALVETRKNLWVATEGESEQRRKRDYAEQEALDKDAKLQRTRAKLLQVIEQLANTESKSAVQTVQLQDMLQTCDKARQKAEDELAQALEALRLLDEEALETLRLSVEERKQMVKLRLVAGEFSQQILSTKMCSQAPEECTDFNNEKNGAERDESDPLPRKICEMQEEILQVEHRNVTTSTSAAATPSLDVNFNLQPITPPREEGIDDMPNKVFSARPRANIGGARPLRNDASSEPIPSPATSIPSQVTACQTSLPGSSPRHEQVSDQVCKRRPLGLLTVNCDAKFCPNSPATCTSVETQKSPPCNKMNSSSCQKEMASSELHGVKKEIRCNENQEIMYDDLQGSEDEIQGQDLESRTTTKIETSPRKCDVFAAPSDGPSEETEFSPGSEDATELFFCP